MMQVKNLIAVGAVSTLLLAGCAAGGPAANPTPTPEVEQPQSPPPELNEGDTGTTNENATGEYTIDMSNYKFSETEITAKPGDTITIKLTNSQGMHDFVIDELDVKSETLEQGEETTVTFDIPGDAAGTSYEYYCSIGNHRQMGMVGTLVVEE